MAITSFGYPGTITPGSMYAKAQVFAGRPWAFPNPSHFRGSINTSGTRLVDVEPGILIAQGIIVEDDAPATVTAPAPSGSSQWHLLTMKLWAPDGDGGYQSELAWISGTATRTVPARATSAGTEYHVPILLARTTSESGQVTDLVDLRVVAESAAGGVTVFSDLGLSLISWWGGVIAHRADNGYTYGRWSDASGSEFWENQTTLIRNEADSRIDGARNLDVRGNFGSSQSGWSTNASIESQVTKQWGHVDLTLGARRTGGHIVSNDDNGNVTDVNIFRLDSAYRPVGASVDASATYVTTAGGTQTAGVTISPSGYIVLTHLCPRVNLRSSDSDSWSIRISASYYAG